MNRSAPTLDVILDHARRRVEALRVRGRELERSAAAAPAAPAFGAALLGATVGVIAEVKRRSPSAGAIRSDLDPVAHARAYVAGGAVAVSVLTEEPHFGGSLDDLTRVARAVRAPVLRKDFIVDELQLLEARAAGASAVLLIARALRPAELLALARAARGCGLATLVETHTEAELFAAGASAVLLIARALRPAELLALARAARGCGLATLVETHTEAELFAALEAEPTAVGVNSRDLGTYEVDLDIAEHLVAAVPRNVPAVAESGIERREDVERLARAGADLVLVGTSVARTADPAAAVRALTGVPRVERGR